MSSELPELHVPTAAAWLRWLGRHHATSAGVLLRLAKGGGKGLTYAQAVEGALIWGWIDSTGRALDETAWLQRYTPRTARSRWSKINCARAEQLIVAGVMEAPGKAAVAAAKADGRWDSAYDSPRTATVPADLELALAAEPRARTFFAALDGANRYAILHRLQDAGVITPCAAARTRGFRRRLAVVMRRAVGDVDPGPRQPPRGG